MAMMNDGGLARGGKEGDVEDEIHALAPPVFGGNHGQCSRGRARASPSSGPAPSPQGFPLPLDDQGLL